MVMAQNIHVNLALKAFTRQLSADEEEGHEEDERNKNTTKLRRQSNAFKWEQFLHEFEVEVNPSDRRPSCGYFGLIKSVPPVNLFPDATQKLWNGFASVAAVTDVQNLKSSLGSATHALCSFLNRRGFTGKKNQVGLEEKANWLLDDMNQFKQLKEDMRRKKLVTNFAITQELPDIIDSRVEILMIKAIETPRAPP